MTTLLFFASILVFAVAYLTYGRLFLQRALGVDFGRATPSHEQYDGIDYVPTKAPVLLGHHFSSIAGAGPIVGPIIAAAAFGWIPALIWILVGSIFIGGVHDFTSIMASIRHRARSIAEIASLYMSPVSYRLFLIFIWLTLSYVLVVFLDLTSVTFTASGGVASSSILYIFLALLFGMSIYRWKLSLLKGSLIFVPLVFIGIWLGQHIPLTLTFMGGDAGMGWDFILLLYCFIASVTPVWILLQPRDYLASYLLYAAVLVGFLGILFGGLPAQYPGFVTWNAPHLGPLFPILFITVACGAVSGFHSIVASGTTAKQLNAERDALTIGYGGMLLEGVVAVIALVTVLIVPLGKAGGAPPQVFAQGIGRFFEVLHMPASLGVQFGLLAISTFLLTTLDTCTRLCRYVFQEFFAMKNEWGRFVATFASLIIPAALVLVTFKDPVTGQAIPAWKAVWPVFGATNQLLAALALMVVTVWLQALGKRVWFVMVPMVFMMVMTAWSLVILVSQPATSEIVRWVAAFLLLLAVVLAFEALRTFILRRRASGRQALETVK
jgi:carbon starvation protein